MTHSQPSQDNNRSSQTNRLLGGEVKVESCLESVELKVAWWEESWSGGGGLDKLLDWLSDWHLSSLNWLSWLLSSEASLVTGQKTSLLVRGVKWVDEGVDSGTVSTGRNSKVLGGDWGRLGGKVGSIGVESEVTVGWVMWVDEWVEVGVDWLINIVVINGLGNWCSLNNRGSWLNWSWGGDWGSLGSKRSRVLSVSSGGNVSSFQDSESILTSRVSDSDSVTLLIDVAVLSYSLSISSGLLSEHSSILCSKS